MKQLIVTAFAACSLMSGFGGLVTSTAAFAQTPCGPNVPPAWTRPGGFCDGSNSTKSLTTPVEGSSGVPCPPEIPVRYLVVRPGERVHVAQVDPCDEECSECELLLGGLAIGDRIHVADVCCVD